MRRLALPALLLLAACGGTAEQAAAPAPSESPSASASSFRESEACRTAAAPIAGLREQLAGADLPTLQGVRDQLEAVLENVEAECGPGVRAPLVRGLAIVRTAAISGFDEGAAAALLDAEAGAQERR